MGEIIMPFKFKAVVRFDTIQDDNFNMRLKADMSWWVSLIYRTEPTTEVCKTEKLKIKNGYIQK